MRIFHTTRIIISSKANVYSRDETENLRLAGKDVSEPSTRIL